MNPDGKASAWQPQSKGIWFTEFGFPSVDGATNQPNVFYDPKSNESAFPHYSKGNIDMHAQRTGILGSLLKWQDSEMIEQMFLWTWDARPFPYWPTRRDIWQDGDLWATGHWLQGKLGLSDLGAIVRELCLRTGLTDHEVNVTRLTDHVTGFIINQPMTARAAIEYLQQAYFFDAVESDGKLDYTYRNKDATYTISAEEIVPQNNQLLTITRQPELELPQNVDVNFIHHLKDYKIGNQHAKRHATSSQQQAMLSFPIVMDNRQAVQIAEKQLYQSWLGRSQYQLTLPMKYAQLEPTDCIDIQQGNVTHHLRITRIDFGYPGLLQIQAVAHDQSIYQATNTTKLETSSTPTLPTVSPTKHLLLDLPALPSEHTDTARLYLAATGLSESWQGMALYQSHDQEHSYHQVASTTEPTIMGQAATYLDIGPTTHRDVENTVEVVLLGNSELESTTFDALLNGANLAIIGQELIQFETATLLAPHHYQLSGLLRGRFGTEWAVNNHLQGEAFVLIDHRLTPIDISINQIGLEMSYKGVSIGQTLSQVDSQRFTYQGNRFVPYTPVHIQQERLENGDLHISWTRRTRINGSWRDGVEVPLGEAKESYLIAIIEAGSTIREIVLEKNSYIYTTEEQMTDFGELKPEPTIHIQQCSETVTNSHYHPEY